MLLSGPIHHQGKQQDPRLIAQALAYGPGFRSSDGLPTINRHLLRALSNFSYIIDGDLSKFQAIIQTVGERCRHQILLTHHSRLPLAGLPAAGDQSPHRLQAGTL